MKLVTLLIPANMPRPYEGATPVPYRSGIVDQFEKKLADLSPVVLRSPNAMRLLPDISGRFAHLHIVTPYQIAVDMDKDSLSEAIVLAFKVFTLTSVTVMSDMGCADFNAEAAEELGAGIHAWNGAAQ